MSVEDINRFTKDDIVCALEMFNEDYVTFPRDDIAKFLECLCRLIREIGENKEIMFMS